MNREETKRILKLMCAAFPNFKPEDKAATLEIWNIVLQEYSYSDVQRALAIYISNNTTGFAPVPGQLIAKINIKKTINQLNAEEAWTLTYKAIGKGNYNAQEEFYKLPDAIKRTIGSPSYLQQMAQTPLETVQTVEKSHFIRTYNAELKQERQIDSIPEQIKVSGGIGLRQFPKLEHKEKVKYIESRNTNISDTTWERVRELKEQLQRDIKEIAE